MVTRSLFSHPSPSSPNLSSRASQSLCLQGLGYKITKITKTTIFGPDRRSHYTPRMPLVLHPWQRSSCFCFTTIPSPKTWEETPSLAPSGPSSLAPRNMPSKLPFAFLLSASPSLGFSFKTGQQASKPLCSSPWYLLQESSTLSLGTSRLIVPFQLCFDLPQMLPTIFLPSPWRPLHLSELDPAQEELLLSYKCFGRILIKGASHPLAQQYGY